MIHKKQSKKILTLHKQTNPRMKRLWEEVEKQVKGRGQKNKISLLHHNISIVDSLNAKQLVHCSLMVCLKTLYLSHNNIESLCNIGQFKNLEHLSVSHNNICQISNIRYLGQLRALTHLSMEFNPIYKQSMYDVYVVGNVGSIKILDNQQLKQENKDQFIKQWNIYESIMQQLIKKYLKLMHLFQFFKKQTTHTELKQVINDHYKPSTLQNLHFKLKLIAQQCQNLTSMYPLSFITSIQQTLYTDSLKINLNIHRTNNIESMISSMQNLSKKQEIKVEDLKSKIISKFTANQPHLPQLEENHIQIRNKIQYALQGKPKQIQYYEWKLLKRVLNSFLHHFTKTKIMKINIQKALVSINHFCIMFVEFPFHKIKNYEQCTLKGKISTNQKVTIKQNQKVQKQVESKNVRIQQLEEENKNLKIEVDESRERQVRLTSKVLLLEKLLNLTEGKLRAYQNNTGLLVNPNDLLEEISHIEETGRKLNFSSSSKSILSNQTMKCSPSSKAHPNKQNKPINLQRKLNLSHKKIKLTDYKSLF